MHEAGNTPDQSDFMHVGLHSVYDLMTSTPLVFFMKDTNNTDKFDKYLEVIGAGLMECDDGSFNYREASTALLIVAIDMLCNYGNESEEFIRKKMDFAIDRVIRHQTH